MTFFSVLLALIIEQVRALSPHNPVSALLKYHAESAAHGFDAGKQKHGVLAWLVVVLPWTLAVGLIYYVLYRINFALAFLWNVVIVYFTLGFRQFSHYFTDIHLALNNDDVPRAREVLSEWTGLDTVDMPVSEIVRHTLVYAVVASHRHVFGVFFWFLIPVGPAGAVFYRIAEYLARSWATPNAERSVGVFERSRSGRSSSSTGCPRGSRRSDSRSSGISRMRSMRGAITRGNGQMQTKACCWPRVAVRSGARLAGPLAEPSSVEALAVGDASPMPVGDDCTPRTLQSAVGLVWRAVILWMLLLLMLTIAVWLA